MASNPAGGHPKPASTRPSLSGTIAKLRKNQPSNPRKVQEALVLIRKYFIKEKTGVDRIRHYGGIEALFEVIRGTNQTCTDIALSIVGNISMDTKVQNKVIHTDGIKALGNVISTVDSPEVVNRACRALGNLAQNPVICRNIHDEEGVIAEVVTHLTKTDDVNLQLTLIRTLRLFADSSAHRLGVLSEEGLRAVSLHLKSEDERVIKAAYQCMLVLAKEFSDVCARQIVAADAPAAVLEHTEHSSAEIRKAAFNVMMNTWMNHHEMRVGIGNAGGIPFFINHITTLTEQRKQLIMANALCLSCCEVVNRVRVKDNGGLQMFLTMLQESEYALLHDRLISALTCFLYDESGWEILMKNGLVSVLIKHLRRIANLDELVQKHGEQDKEEESGLSHKIEQNKSEELRLSSKMEQVKGGGSECSKKSQQNREEVAMSSNIMKFNLTEKDGKPQAGSSNKEDNDKKETVTPNIGVEKDTEEDVESNSKVEQEETQKDEAIIVTDKLPSIDNTSLDSSTSNVAKRQITMNIEIDDERGLQDNKQALGNVTDKGISETSTVQKAHVTSMQISVEHMMKADATEPGEAKHGEMEDKAKSNVTRYSVDSPTYKSVVDWTPDDYMSGPKNILESEHYQCGSPDRLSGYSSPSNYGPYSPLSISSFDLSPDTSPRPRSVSPYLSSPEKRLPPSPESSSRGSSSCQRLSPPMWSPTHSTFDEASSSQFSVLSSHAALSSEFASPLILAGGSNDLLLDEALRYSSSDEDEDGDIKDLADVSDGDEFDIWKKEDYIPLPGEGVTPSTSFALNALDDTKPAEVTSGYHTSKTIENHRLNSDTSDTDGGSSSVKGKRTPLSGKSGTKRKRDLTPEMRKRILLSVEQSKRVPSLSIDLTTMMSASNIFNKTRELGLQKELPSDKRDHRRQTEYCLIMLIKKISCYADPTDDLINPTVLGTLMDYVSFAARTFSKCGRILVRLTKNTECFKMIILKMIPHLINDRLVTKSIRIHQQKDCEAKAKKMTKEPEVFNRSMSACTLSETTKAVQFHHDVKRQRNISATKTRGVKRSEAAQLKAELFSSLAFMAETPFGQGVLEHLLLTASTSDRMKTAVALSLICRSRSLQTKMYIEHNGFRYLIMAIEQSEDADLQRQTMCGLFTMASLHTNKQFSAVTKPPMLPSKEERKPDEADPSSADNDVELFDVVFKMEDGSEVGACRATLMQHSEVFNAMLDGHYSESGKSEINMPGVSYAAFKIVVNHLHEKPLDGAYELDVVLEAHGLADRFILDNLTRILCDLMVDRHLKMDVLQKIFAHAVLHEAYWVMKKCMNFLLLDPTVSDVERLSRFQLVLNSPQGGVAVDVIEDMFKS